MKIAIPKELPVEYLFVKKGIIRLIDEKGNAFVLAEHLDGKIRDLETELQAELNGRFATSKNNLAITGSLSWTGGNHHVSVRLDRTEIKDSFTFGDFTVDAGILEGNVDLSFPDTLSLASLHSTGRMTIDSGICRIGKSDEFLTGFSVRVSTSGTLLQMDSLHCRWHGMHVASSGFWNYATSQGKIIARADSVDADSLSGHATMAKTADSLHSPLRGKGRLDVVAAKDATDSAIRITVVGGGFNFQGLPLALTAGGRVDSARVRVDSLRVNAKNIVARLDGSCAFTERFPFKGTLAIVTGAGGTTTADKVRAAGSFCGNSVAMTASLTLSGAGAVACGLPMEGLKFELAYRNSKLTFATSGAALALNGSIDHLISPMPQAECSFKIAPGE